MPDIQSRPDTPRCTDAAHPFDQPSADLILRTADLVDFRVHSAILAQASPFFASMLALPQPTTRASPSGGAGGRAGEEVPVVPISEDSTTLELLLRLIYPIALPRALMEDPQKMVPALFAATKYEMERPLEIMSERLAVITPKSPLQVWAAACRTGLEDVARQAALALRKSWTRNEQEEALSFMKDLGNMSGISAGDYFRLKQFLKAGQSAIDEGHLTLLSPPRELAAGVPHAALPPPFATRLPSTDVTCRATWRTGEEATFLAHQVVLSMHSLVLEARLAELRNARSNVPSSGSSNSPSVAPIELQFDEDAGVVSDLLRACYDLAGALPDDLTRLAVLLVVSRKYGMARVAREALVAWDAAADSRPLEAYIVASNHGLSECAKAAAKDVLTAPIADAYATVMDSAPALAYHRLLVYYDACRHAASERVNEVGRRMKYNIYINGHNISNVIEAITKFFVSGATLRPGNGNWRSELYGDLENKSYGFKFLRPFMEWAISLPDMLRSTIDEIQIELD